MGDAFELQAEACSHGWELLKMIQGRVPTKPGTHLLLQHGHAELDMHKSLKEQGFDETLGVVNVTYIHVSVDVLSAWKCLSGALEQESRMEGVTEVNWLERFEHTDPIGKLPRSLETLTFTFGFRFGFQCELGSQLQRLSNLRKLTLGHILDQSLEQVKWPPNLQELNLGFNYNLPLDKVFFPSSLLHLTLSNRFDLPLDDVRWPENLQTLTFGEFFNRRLKQGTLPETLRNLTFGHRFSKPLGQAGANSCRNGPTRVEKTRLKTPQVC